MTLEQIKALTDEELRVKIAELLGVKNIEKYACAGEREADWHGQRTTFPRGYVVSCHTFKLPNYPKDLNACHEMEATLRGDDWHKYGALLKSTAQWRWFATARQRCEAFLLTMTQ